MKNHFNTTASGTRFRTVCAVLLAAAMLFQTGCSLFGSDDGTSAGDSGALPDLSGYDVVLVLDESSSLNDNEKRMRNKAANIFIQMLTETSSVGTVFFGKNVNKTEGCDSLRKEKNREKYLDMFGTGKSARMYKSDDGTRQDKGIKAALKILSGSSNPNQAILLFTDGMSYDGRGSATSVKDINTMTAALAKKALTANNGEPIPIYVVYLDQKKGNKVKYLNTLQKTFSTDGHPAVKIDSPEYNPEIWDTVPWNDTSVNKIIATDDPDALTEIFSKLLNKMRNLASFSFKDEYPDENSAAVIKFDVPAFEASRIQVIVTGKKKFTVAGARHVDGKEAGYKLNQTAEAGEYKVINIDARNGSFSPGQWELEIQSDAAVSGSVSLFSDFQTKVSLLQGGSTVKKAKSFTDTEVKVEFVDSSGDVIKLGEGWTGDVTVGKQRFGSMSVRKNALFSPAQKIETEGEIPVHIILKYRKMLYGIDSKIDVIDAAPVILKEKANCIYSSYQRIGGFVDIGKASEFVCDAKDGEGLTVSVEDDSGDTAFVSTYGEMAEISRCKLKEEPDSERHLFLSDRSGRHTVTIKATDSAGKTVVGRVVVSIRSKEAVNLQRTLLGLFVGTALVAAVLITRKRKYLSGERMYNVLAIFNDGAAIAPIPCMSDLHERARIRIYLSRQRFFRKNSKYADAGKVRGLPFTLDAGDSVILRLSFLRAFREHLPLSGFTVETVSDGGDSTRARHIRRCRLDPGKTYVVTYAGNKLRLSFSQHDCWNGIFTSLEK